MNFKSYCTLILFVFLACISVASQNTDENAKRLKITAETFIRYPHFFVKNTHEFNYGIGEMVSLGDDRLRFSTGYYYTEFRNYSTYQNSGNVSKISNKISYSNIPFLVGIAFLEKRGNNKNYFVASTGIGLHIPSHYESTTYYNDGSASTKNNMPVKYYSGTSALVNLQYFRKLNNNWALSFGLNGQYEFYSSYWEIPNSAPHPGPGGGNQVIKTEKTAIGIQIGIAYVFSGG